MEYRQLGRCGLRVSVLTMGTMTFGGTGNFANVGSTGVDQGLGVLVWSPLAGGLLSGRYRRDSRPDGGSRQLTDWNEPPVHDPDKLYDTVDTLLAVAAELDASAAQVALAWLLGRPGVSTLVIGARTTGQLADNLAAADLTLSADQRYRLDRVSAQRLLYPHWHQAKTARDRLSPADRTLLGPHL